jgi:hypothetical protein
MGVLGWKIDVAVYSTSRMRRGIAWTPVHILFKAERREPQAAVELDGVLGRTFTLNSDPNDRNRGT